MKLLLLKIHQFFLNKNPLKIVAIILIILVLPLIVLIAQKQQEIRQRASELGNNGTYQVPVLSLKYLPVKLCGNPTEKIDLTNATATSSVAPYNAQAAIDSNMNTK